MKQGNGTKIERGYFRKHAIMGCNYVRDRQFGTRKKLASIKKTKHYFFSFPLPLRTGFCFVGKGPNENSLEAEVVFLLPCNVILVRTSLFSSIGLLKLRRVEVVTYKNVLICRERYFYEGKRSVE